MARITLGIASSHTPLLTFEATQWERYAQGDLKRRLNMSDGRYITYDELLAETGGRHASVATVEQFLAKEASIKTAMDRIAADIASDPPDVMVILTDDESELFSKANMPAFSIYYADEVVTRTFGPERIGQKEPPPFFPTMLKNYAMDESRRFPAMPDFARELIERLIDKHIDVGAAHNIEDVSRSGLGHGVGFIIQRYFGGKPVPIVPVLLNTYYPPNAPKPARCYDIGKALREAIEESPRNLKVGIAASGGLSHFVVDETLDRGVLRAITTGDAHYLRNISVAALNSGSSEIRCWIAVAGVIAGLKNQWCEYFPLYRTPAGTGIGVGLGLWR